jgi:hypothetical protein
MARAVRLCQIRQKYRKFWRKSNIILSKEYDVRDEDPNMRYLHLFVSYKRYLHLFVSYMRYLQKNKTYMLYLQKNETYMRELQKPKPTCVGYKNSVA